MSLAEASITTADTECHRQGEGYERTLIFQKWDSNNVRRLARVQIRVDRFRQASFANVDVWIPTSGWQYVTSVPQEEFWEQMPSYTRGQTRHADRETLNLADELIDRLIESRV